MQVGLKLLVEFETLSKILNFYQKLFLMNSWIAKFIFWIPITNKFKWSFFSKTKILYLQSCCAFCNYIWCTHICWKHGVNREETRKLPHILFISLELKFQKFDFWNPKNCRKLFLTKKMKSTQNFTLERKISYKTSYCGGEIVTFETLANGELKKIVFFIWQKFNEAIWITRVKLNNWKISIRHLRVWHFRNLKLFLKIHKEIDELISQ